MNLTWTQTQIDINSDSNVSIKLDTSDTCNKDKNGLINSSTCCTNRSQSPTKLKHLSRNGECNFLRVLFGKGSDGDLLFHKKEAPNSFHMS